MAQVRDYKKLAEDIIRETGGKENIAAATRCATRLRLVLKETPENAKEKISAMPGVITVVENSGQFQIVIGTHVGDVYSVVAELLNLDEEGEAATALKQSILNRIIATMSAVFAPFVYILAAAGILQGVLILVNLAVPSFALTGTYEVLNFMSWAPFTFLPIFIAITAAKHFKCSMFIAVLCCCALVSPTWAEMAARIADGEVIRLFGLPLSETVYTSTVLPPLFLVWILSYLERFLEKHLPETVKPLLTPLISFLIMVPGTILVIGPASTIAANGIAQGYNFLADTAPALAGAIIGGLWEVVVIFGVHWGITPVVLANFDNLGFDTFQAFQTIAVVAQIAAAFGVFIKSRNKQFKGVALSAGITGIFGITEPTIYGVTLRLKKPFICGCVGGAIGAVVMSFFHSAYYAYAGLPGILTIVNAISPDAPMSFIGEVIGCAVAIVITIVSIQVIGFVDPKEENKEISAVLEAKTADGKRLVLSPLSGRCIPLEEVKDEVFSGGLMGQGAAIVPKDGAIYAPFDGTIVTLMDDTLHAVGLESEDGIETLIHVGMDTVKLKGQYFKAHVKEGEYVKAGQLLLEFDIDKIKGAGYDVTTPVIVTNSDEFTGIKTERYGEIIKGDKLLSLI